MSMNKELLKYYKPPFYLDEGSVMVFDSNNNLVFQFKEDIDLEIARETLRRLNRESWDVSPKVDDGCSLVTKDNQPFIEIRGWGRLTGPEKLSCEEASDIQDEFGDWIVNKLNS